MITGTFTINNKTGLHVRPAGYLVKVLQPFESEVVLKFKDKQFNAKSVLGVISAAIKKGDEVTFEVEGKDEEATFKAIEAAVATGLGEEA